MDKMDIMKMILGELEGADRCQAIAKEIALKHNMDELSQRYEELSDRYGEMFRALNRCVGDLIEEIDERLTTANSIISCKLPESVALFLTDSLRKQIIMKLDGSEIILKEFIEKEKEKKKESSDARN